MWKKVWVAIVWVGALSLSAGCGGNAGALSPEDASNAGELIDRANAAATAEASSTSTAYTNYGEEVNDARARWDSQNVQNYVWHYTFSSPDANGTQDITIRVENGQIADFKHDCFPASVCLRINIENENNFTVSGVLDTLAQLAEDDHPLAIINFNDEYGYPQSIAANSDEAPYYIGWKTETFEVTE